jgi:hypothetical protein
LQNYQKSQYLSISREFKTGDFSIEINLQENQRGNQAKPISGDSEQGLIPTYRTVFCSKETRLNFVN